MDGAWPSGRARTENTHSGLRPEDNLRHVGNGGSVMLVLVGMMGVAQYHYNQFTSHLTVVTSRIGTTLSTIIYHPPASLLIPTSIY